MAQLSLSLSRPIDHWLAGGSTPAKKIWKITTSQIRMLNHKFVCDLVPRIWGIVIKYTMQDM
jgi:hypothetical protein